MRRLALPLALLLAVPACGSEDPPDEPAPPPTVQQRKKPVWCPKQRFEQVRREDGRYDVRRLPHGTFDARGVLGLALDDAKSLAEQNDCRVRVVERDGEKLSRTDDLRPNRINVRVERGYVTALSEVG